MIVSQTAGKDAGGFRVGGPFVHALSIPEGGDPFEQADEALATGPVTLAKRVAQVLAARLGAVVGGGGFADGEEQMAQGRRGEGVRGGR